MDNLEDKDKITTKPKLGNREEILNGPIIKTKLDEKLKNHLTNLKNNVIL